MNGLWTRTCFHQDTQCLNCGIALSKAAVHPICCCSPQGRRRFLKCPQLVLKKILWFKCSMFDLGTDVCCYRCSFPRRYLVGGVQRQNKVKLFICAQMQPDKCNAQHPAVQHLEWNRLRYLLTGTERLQLARRDVSSRDTFLHKGKLTGSKSSSRWFYWK